PHPPRAPLHHLGRFGRPAARLRQPRELHDLRQRRAHVRVQARRLRHRRRGAEDLCRRPRAQLREPALPRRVGPRYSETMKGLVLAGVLLSCSIAFAQDAPDGTGAPAPPPPATAPAPPPPAAAMPPGATPSEPAAAPVDPGVAA